ncbi:MAG: TetR/AcrR family transcriptional regulator [Phycicoccus sp.]
MNSSAPSDQKLILLGGAVDHVLEHGIGTVSLRPLAAALGTSDRMLIYYFGTREALLVAVLHEVGRRLAATLDDALPVEPVSAGTLFAAAGDLVDDPAVERYLRLYIELSGLAAAGREPFRAATAGIADGWMAWTAARLDPAEGRPEETAAGILALVDGVLLLRFVLGGDRASQAHTWLTRVLTAALEPRPEDVSGGR